MITAAIWLVVCAWPTNSEGKDAAGWNTLCIIAAGVIATIVVNR